MHLFLAMKVLPTSSSTAILSNLRLHCLTAVYLITMSTNTERLLIIQNASRKLCVASMRHVLSRFSLRRGDIVKILGISKAFTKKGCGPWLENKRKLHSSATVNKRRDDVEEEAQRARERYLNCPEYKEMLNMTSALQVELEITVQAGLLKEVAVEYAKSCQATNVILYRRPKKEVNYFTQNLHCGVYKLRPNCIKIVRPPQADEVGRDPPPETSKPESRGLMRITFIHPSCSVCDNRRQWIGLRRKFTYAELQLATNGFCQKNLVPDHGRKIYLGLLNDQRKTLIRKSPSVTIKEEQFKREVQILEDVWHENVALLIGSCSEGPHRLLVYEYVCNGSLNKLLSDKSKELTWERRIHIAYGAARGLEYLHTERIYGSVKPSNILITHDYHPRISYYGLTVNQYEALGQSSDTTTLRTFEYLAPEYQETGIDLSKADVYSYGVVLLELITGRKTIYDTSGQSFLRWARPLLRQKNYKELIDPMLQESVDLYQLYWLIRVAYKCLSWEPRSRCSMKRVADALFCIVNRSLVEDFSPTGSEW